jgi:hypothetical protein
VYEFDRSGNGTNYDVRGQRLSASGSLLGGNVFTTLYSYNEFYPDIAFCPGSNQYLVAFEYDNSGNGSDYDILARRVHSDGTLSSSWPHT